MLVAKDMAMSKRVTIVRLLMLTIVLFPISSTYVQLCASTLKYAPTYYQCALNSSCLSHPNNNAYFSALNLTNPTTLQYLTST